ncbi:MAG: hypothetical protein VB042_04350 [Victivallaceae bacterium]|nr:hypothetical protein [Victivallaceae bacterium]
MQGFSLEEVEAAFEKSRVRTWRFFRTGAAVAACLSLLPAILWLVTDHSGCVRHFLSRDGVSGVFAGLIVAGGFWPMLPLLCVGIAEKTAGVLRCGKCGGRLLPEAVLKKGVCTKCGEFLLRPPPTMVSSGIESLWILTSIIAIVWLLLIFVLENLYYDHLDMIVYLILPVNALLMIGLIMLSLYRQSREARIVPKICFYPDELVSLPCTRSESRRIIRKDGYLYVMIAISVMIGLPGSFICLGWIVSGKNPIILSVLPLGGVLLVTYFLSSWYRDINRNSGLSDIHCPICKRGKAATDHLFFWYESFRIGRCMHCGRRLIFRDEADPADCER